MRRGVIAVGAVVLAILGGRAAAQLDRAARQPAAITVDYPLDGSVFPPDFPAPQFLWRDLDSSASTWTIEATFADGGTPIRVDVLGERMLLGTIDPRCVAPTNALPKLTPEQEAAHTWRPDAETWRAIRKRSSAAAATLRITGYAAGNPRRVVSQGQVSIRTSTDPVGAPIFYRDVPLMPAETEKGVIKPLATSAIPLIAWRLRNVGEEKSHLLMEGIHSCANCHSVSRDGKTLGMDLDGPQNDKGLYAIAAVRPRMSIRNEDVISWTSFRGPLRSVAPTG